MKKNTKTILKSLLVFSALAFSMQAFASWAPPACPLPCNTPAPLNTSNVNQVKTGGLRLGGLFVTGFADVGLDLTVARNIFTVGSVGIGTTGTLGAKLDVNGQVKITQGNPGLNKVLASDNVGLASWKTLAELGGGGGVMTTLGDMIYGLANGVPAPLHIGSTGQVLTVSNGIPAWQNATGGGNVGNGGINGTANYVTKWTGTTTIGNSQIFDNGASVGIGTATPAANAKLEVSGQVKITGGTPALNKVLASDATGLASWKTLTELGGGGGGGGGGSNPGFDTSWRVAGCSTPLGAGSLNTIDGIYSYHFTVPPSMNGWKLYSYHASACDGDGDITITPQIKKSNGTLQNLTAITVTAWNVPGEWTGSVTVNTGDRIKVGNWTNSGELNGLAFTFRIKP